MIVLHETGIDPQIRKSACVPGFGEKPPRITKAAWRQNLQPFDPGIIDLHDAPLLFSSYRRWGQKRNCAA